MTEKNYSSSSLDKKNFLWQKPIAVVSDKKIDELSARLDTIAKKSGIKKIANSLSAEDMLLLHHWHLELKLSGGDFFMLETGRLHQATLDYLYLVEKHYSVVIEKIIPNEMDVKQMVAEYGLNGFYDSIEARKACCGVRKVSPLRRILSHADLWVTGQRQGQGITRGTIEFQENDIGFGLEKYNPLFDWHEGEVFAYIKKYAVPLHPLYDKGYASIGCEPCSRAIKAEEDIRAGRWWWEYATNKECGINQINLQK
ncbi:MAG: phosphoadenylyl-sulfate reductase [Alphaproteobacteria bacterium]